MASLKGTEPRHDYLTKAGAAKLAVYLKAYWCGRGYLNVWADVTEIKNIPGHYQVRSNIQGNGYPPGAPTALRALV